MIQGNGYWILFVEQASSVDAVQYSCISALRIFMVDENPSLRPLKGKLMEFAFMRSCFDILESETSEFFTDVLCAVQNENEKLIAWERRHYFDFPAYFWQALLLKKRKTLESRLRRINRP